jgi:hypothetical protein
MLWAGGKYNLIMACIASLIDPSKNKVVKTWSIDKNYKTAESLVKKKNEQLNSKLNKKGLFWVITTIGV